MIHFSELAVGKPAARRRPVREPVAEKNVLKTTLFDQEDSDEKPMTTRSLMQALPDLFRRTHLSALVGLSFAVLGGHAQAQATNSPPAGYALCAAEGQRCTFSGAAQVVYGARTTWTSPRSFTGGVACNNSTFGDPLRGVPKACYVQAAPAPAPAVNVPPAGFTLCAAESQRCNFSGAAQVVYGARTTWTSPRSFTGGVACNNTTFGDPLRGVLKACYAKADPAPAPAPAPAGAPVAAMDATRLSGPAPLAVQFDATASTKANADAFRELSYSFNFGDPSSGTWALSGLSKNTQVGGPLAAHVFDLPGTYTVRVRALAAGGAYTDAAVTVTVQSPDAVFSGTKTVCISGSSNYAGCPAGALLQTTLPGSYGGKRVLLRRGESFGAIVPLNTDADFQVGAFGAGAKPTVAGVSTWMVNGVAAWANDFTVMDLDIGGGSVDIGVTTSRFLLYRNDIKTSGAAEAKVNIGTAAGYVQEHDSGPVPGAVYWPKEVFIVDNDIQGVVNAGGQPNLVMMGHFHRSAIMGNTIDYAKEHSLRIWAASKLVISHNRIGGNHLPESNGIGIRGATKIHSGGVQAFASTIAAGRYPATSQLVMANNIIGSPTYPGSFLSGFGPQNADAGTIEGLEDCIAENNVYVRGPFTSSELQLRGRRLTARGNTVQGGGTPNISRSGATFDPALGAWDGPYFIQ